MNRMPSKLALITACATLVLAACSGGAPQASNDHVLRIAMGSPGEAQIRVWDDVAKQYMTAHPETKVEMNYQQDDLYETIGLQNLLAGRNAPDVYFEWTGERLKQRQKDGYVADITEQFKSGPLKGLFTDVTEDRRASAYFNLHHEHDISNATYELDWTPRSYAQGIREVAADGWWREERGRAPLGAAS